MQCTYYIYTIAAFTHDTQTISKKERERKRGDSGERNGKENCLIKKEKEGTAPHDSTSSDHSKGGESSL